MDNTQKSLEQERKELNLLIGKGVTFDVQDVEFVPHKGVFGIFRKFKPKKITRKYKIEELTLATLDRISAELIELTIDEAKMKSDDAMQRARGLAGQHAIRCAKIIAIAVLGEELWIPLRGRGGVVKWVEDTKRLDNLTSLFARKIKPSTLNQLIVLVNAMCNLGDFLNSIRLIQIERTTMPIRIEENNED